jgi:hypothetical protein
MRIRDSNLIQFFRDLEGNLGMKGRAEGEIQRHIIKMSLETDENGFVYFNDLLFKSMKLRYGEEHVRNKVLGFAETKAILKLNKYRKRVSKQFRQKEKKAFSLANPFLAMMYYNKAFKKWKIRWYKNLER